MARGRAKRRELSVRHSKRRMQISRLDTERDTIDGRPISEHSLEVWDRTPDMDAVIVLEPYIDIWAGLQIQ